MVSLLLVLQPGHTLNTGRLLRKKLVGGFCIQISRSWAGLAFPRHALLP